MKILFIVRATLNAVKGGDTVQVNNTAGQLRKLGIDVDIELCSNEQISYRQYQLIHFFNIIRPADILYHIDKSKLPFVVSPIYVEYDKLQGQQGIQHKLVGMLGKYTMEYAKTIARSLTNNERIVSKKYLLLRHKRSIAYILRRCSHLLPNSQSEYSRLKRDFPFAGTYTVIPNAIDAAIFNNTAAFSVREEGSVLCVARFEPRKNQLNVIKALAHTAYKVTFVGNIAPNHHAYYAACRAAAGPGISFIEFTDAETLAGLYRRHKVHILASWFETTGLSTLEAASCGCNIVISRNGDTEEYFGNHAIYCDPSDINDIKNAVSKAMSADADNNLERKITEQYTWAVTARKTAEVYKNIMSA